jgi:D-alanyl-D-alanine carboxypeptidase/D-alanyl-D-alanine-endopeptidase (penicillin-binding protein 4)
MSGYNVSMRTRTVAITAALAAFALLAAPLSAQAAQTGLQQALGAQMALAGSSSSAYVVDVTSGAVVFADKAGVPRLPASVEKLYTTSTALLKLGPTATFKTSVYGAGTLRSDGTWVGNLYLRGGGDPSFGSTSFDRLAYGGGTTMQALVRDLLSVTGITAVHGAIVADESYFDSDRGTPATANRPNAYVEGQLSGLVYNRGFTDATETVFQPRPALFTAQAFAAALRADHVKVPAGDPIYAGRTPQRAQLLSATASPRLETLIDWTNTPSDNFFAETLLKDLGAQFGAGGTTAAGAAVARALLAANFGIHPRLNDGSGLSYYDHTSPQQVVALLSKMASNPVFVNSLAIAGETGTLQYEMNGTIAQGRCRGKTGTLQAVSNLAGYCTAQNGHTLAFAFLMSSIDPYTAHPIQNAMAEALAGSTA